MRTVHVDNSTIDNLKSGDKIVFRLGRNVGKYIAREYFRENGNYVRLYKISDQVLFKKLRIIKNNGSEMYPVRGSREEVIDTVKKIYSFINEAI